MLRFIFLILPTKLLSRLTGELTEWEAPQVLLRFVIRMFVRQLNINLEEAVIPVGGFKTFQSFFARPLKEGQRPVEEDKNILCSPADGTVGACGRINNGQALQIKGRPYTIAELLGDANAAEQYEGGTYITIYLSPRDYHRFHSPDDVSVNALSYIPGKLWPVFPKMLKEADVFCENERVIAHTEHDDYRLALIPVGAYNVGRMRIYFSDIQANHKDRVFTEQYAQPVSLKKGEEWGYFGFGSTIVMLFKSTSSYDAFVLPNEGAPIKMGEALLKR